MRAHSIGLIFIGLIFIGLSLAPSAPAQTLTPCKDVQVMDAVGRSMGHSVSEDNAFQGGRRSVYVRLDEKKDDFIALELGYTPTAGAPVQYNWYQSVIYYDSADCSGQAYAPARGPFGTRLAAIGNTTLFVSALNPTGAQRTVYSHQYMTNGCSNGATSLWLVAVNPVLDLNDHFTPPFRQQCQPE